MLGALSIALLMPSEPLPQQSRLLASTEVARGFRHSTVSVSKAGLLSHSAVVAWEAYLELLIPKTEGSQASHRMRINGDDIL